MNDMQRRVKALEAAAGMGSDRIDVIVRTFVSPGPSGAQDCPLIALVSPEGWRIDRSPGEEREAFVRRACDAAPRKTHGVICLREVLGEAEETL